MNSTKRPLAVTCLAILYVAIGAIGLVLHFPAFQNQGQWQFEDFWIELTEAIALISGIFLWKGRNWARWLVLAWMAFHIALSAFNGPREVIVHSVIGCLIAWALFAPPGSRYFASRSQSSSSPTA